MVAWESEICRRHRAWKREANERTVGPRHDTSIVWFGSERRSGSQRPCPEGRCTPQTTRMTKPPVRGTRSTGAAPSLSCSPKKILGKPPARPANHGSSKSIISSSRLSVFQMSRSRP